MKIRPLQDRVLVQPILEKDVRKGGIIIPDSAKEKPIEGRVKAVGQGKLGGISRGGNHIHMLNKLALVVLAGVLVGAPYSAAAQNPDGPWLQYASPEEAGFSSEKLAEAREIAESNLSGAVIPTPHGTVAATRRGTSCFHAPPPFTAARAGQTTRRAAFGDESQERRWPRVFDYADQEGAAACTISRRAYRPPADRHGTCRR